MANEPVVIKWPPRDNSLAIWTNLGRTLIRLGCYLHGYPVIFQQEAAPIPEVAAPSWHGGKIGEAYAQIAAQLPAPPVPQRSWVSEWVRSVLGWQKVPAVTKAHVVECRLLRCQRILLANGVEGGPEAHIEILTTAKGWGQILIGDGLQVRRAITLKAGGEVNDDFVHDGAVAGAVDMGADGRLKSRIPAMEAEPGEPVVPPVEPITPVVP